MAEQSLPMHPARPAQPGGIWRVLRSASPALLVLGLLVAWEMASVAGLADMRNVSSPSAIGALVVEWTANGFVWPHVAATLIEVGVGYVAGTLIGMALAFLFFFYPRLAALLDPLISVLNAAPRAVLAPFFVLVFGMGLVSKIMLVVFVVFVITLINLYTGLRDVDRTIVDNARVLGGNRRQLIRHVYVPAALVWIASAMRVSIGQAFTAAIICELLGSTKGLGWIVAAGQSAIKPDWIMAGLFFASVVVVVVDLAILEPLERRGSHWRVF